MISTRIDRRIERTDSDLVIVIVIVIGPGLAICFIYGCRCAWISYVHLQKVSPIFMGNISDSAAAIKALTSAIKNWIKLYPHLAIGSPPASAHSSKASRSWGNQNFEQIHFRVDAHYFAIFTPDLKIIRYFPPVGLYGFQGV